MASRLLVVEDDKKISASICNTMINSGYCTTSVSSGEEAFFIASTEAVDAIVLALGLPGCDGIDVLCALREQHNNVPIVILSAHADVSDRIHALKAGADDYLTKPFSVDELEARLQSILRRGKVNNPRVITVADLTLDTSLRRVTREGHLIKMTALEFCLIELLMRNARRVVTRQTLSQGIWNGITRATPLDNVMDVHIGRIRRKIDLPDHPKLIHTIRGVGFMLSDSHD